MQKIFSIAAALLLAACSSTPPPVYYTLPDSGFVMPEHTRGRTQTAVRVVLAEPFNRGGLVYRPAADRMSLAKGHLWARPLEQALASRLSNELNRAGGARRYYVPAHQSSAAQSVVFYVEEFGGSWQGETRVAGYMQNGDDNRRFDAATPQEGDGYPAMLSSLSRGISSAVRQLGAVF
ncbi:MAG: ABC-type transport auxiliary lipoprotein family protein [Neisseria sp.]|nr:ABC-type transport auxiliary lipoprotein family protein [Neisseria sp.]